jgi:hypothetical protein
MGKNARDPIFSRFFSPFLWAVRKWTDFSSCQNVIGSCYHDYKAEKSPTKLKDGEKLERNLNFSTFSIR